MKQTNETATTTIINPGLYPQKKFATGNPFPWLWEVFSSHPLPGFSSQSSGTESCPSHLCFFLCCICLSFCIHSRINLDLQCQASKRSSGFSLFWIIWSLNVKSSNNDTYIHLFIYFPFCQPPQSHDHTVGDTGGSHFSLHWPSPTITPACHLQPWTENTDHDTNQEGNAMDKESGVRGPLLSKDSHGSSEL